MVALGTGGQIPSSKASIGAPETPAGGIGALAVHDGVMGCENGPGGDRESRS